MHAGGRGSSGNGRAKKERKVAINKDAKDGRIDSSIPPAFRDAILSEEDEESCPIHAAVKFADMDILNETLEEQKDRIRETINKLDSKGRTSLDLAALTGQTDMLEILTSRGGSYKYKNVVRMKRTAKARRKKHQLYVNYIESIL